MSLTLAIDTFKVAIDQAMLDLGGQRNVADSAHADAYDEALKNFHLAVARAETSFAHDVTDGLATFHGGTESRLPPANVKAIERALGNGADTEAEHQDHP